MGLNLKIQNSTFTDTTLPKLRADPLLYDGSVQLIDFGRGDLLPIGTVPAHLDLLPNVARLEALALIAGSTESGVCLTFINGFAATPTKGLVERTTKGGLHIISSKVGQVSEERYCGPVAVSASNISTYMFANVPGRSFYMSVWGRITRASTSSLADAQGGMFSATSSTGNYAALLASKTTAFNSPGTLGEYHTPLASGHTSNYFANRAFNAWSGTKPSTVGNQKFVFWHGSFGVYVPYQFNASASGILYRIYLEDLTASGRAYSVVSDLDQALYAEAFGTGGRFANDTFSAPGTALP